MADKTQELDETLLNLDNDNGMILGLNDDELIPLDPPGPTTKYSEYDTCYVNVRYYYILNSSSNWQPTGSSQDINLIENAGIYYGGMYVSGSYTDIQDHEATWNSDYSYNHFFDTSTNVLKTSTKDTYLYCCFVVRRYGSHSDMQGTTINKYTSSGISVDVSIGTVHRCTNDSSIDAVKFSYCYGPDTVGGAYATIEEYSTDSGATSTICINRNGSYSTVDTPTNIKIKNANSNTFIDANKRTSLSGLTWNGSGHQYYESANVSLYVYKIAHINFIYNNTDAAAQNYINPPSIKYYPALCVHAAQAKSLYPNLTGSGTYKTDYTWYNLRPDPNAANGLTTTNAYITIEYEANPGNLSHKFFITTDSAIQSKVKLLYTRRGNASDEISNVMSANNWPSTNWTIDNTNNSIKLTTDLDPGDWPANNNFTLDGFDADIMAESFVYIDRENINTNSSIYLNICNTAFNSSVSTSKFEFFQKPGAYPLGVTLYEFKTDTTGFDNVVIKPTNPNANNVPGFFSKYINDNYYYCPHVSHIFTGAGPCSLGSNTYLIYGSTTKYLDTQFPIGIYESDVNSDIKHINYINNYVQYNCPLIDDQMTTKLNFWLSKLVLSTPTSSTSDDGSIYKIGIKVSDILSTPNNIAFDSPYMKSYAVCTSLESPDYNSNPAIGLCKSICYIVHFIMSGTDTSEKKALTLENGKHNLITSDDYIYYWGDINNPTTCYDLSDYFTFNILKNNQNYNSTESYTAYKNDFDNNTTDKWNNVITPKQLMHSTMWYFAYSDSYLGLYDNYNFNNILGIDYLTGKVVGSLQINQSLSSYINGHNILGGTDVSDLDITDEDHHSTLFNNTGGNDAYSYDSMLAAALFGTGVDYRKDVLKEHQYILYNLRYNSINTSWLEDDEDRYISYDNAVQVSKESTLITCVDRDITYTGYTTWWNNGNTTRYPHFTVVY